MHALIVVYLLGHFLFLQALQREVNGICDVNLLDPVDARFRQRLDAEIQWLHGKGLKSEEKARYAKMECRNAQGLLNTVFTTENCSVKKLRKSHHSLQC